MKRHVLATALLCLPLAASAQTSAVPAAISYQGKVTDAAGNLIGTGTPTNRDVIFRVYDGPTSSTILYAERQNVTIANGEFSVLLGQGSPVAAEPKPALDQAFLANQRYLGITVDDGNPGADLEITPRQQIATTPFAFRARVAEGLIDNAVSGASMLANNVVTNAKIADATITGAKIAGGAIGNGNLASSAVDSAKIADFSIGTADLGNNVVTAGKLASDIGVWSTVGSNIYRNSSVAIGSTADPGERLTVAGNIRLDWETYVSFSGSANNFAHNTKTMPNYGIGSFGDSDLGANPSLWLSGYQGLKLFTQALPRLTVTQPGRVGIGTVTPDDQLNVYSTVGDTAIRIQNSGTGLGENSTDGLRIGIGPDSQNGTLRAFVQNLENTKMFFGTNGGSQVTVYPDSNRVGLCGENSDSQAGVYIANSSVTYPLIIQTGAGNFYFNSSGQASKPGGGSWASNSDIRLKTDVKDLSGSLEKLLQLHSVTFRYNDEARYGKGEQTGFIAQEVEKVFPNWVIDGPDGFKSVSVYGFESLTVQALRELRAEKEAEIAALQKRAESAEARLAELEKKVAALVAAQR